MDQLARYVHDATLDSEIITLEDFKPYFARFGACRTRPDVAFFVERGQDSRPAKQVCAGCVVQQQCLDYAIEHRISHGIWGGCSERERRRLRTSARAA